MSTALVARHDWLRRRPFYVPILAGALLSACAFLPRVTPTEPPFCAPLVDSVGSVQLDYDVRPVAPPAVSARAAEAAARDVFGKDAGTTCFVRAGQVRQPR